MANRTLCHLLLVAMVTSLMGFGVNGQQTFDITPSDASGFLGSSVTLQCASSDKTGQLMWIRTGRLISRDTEVLLNVDRYSITGDQSNGEYFLTLSDLQEDDAGTYYCILAQGGGNAATSTPGVTLTVLTTTQPSTGTPSPPQSFRTEPQDTTVDEGNTAVLQCAVDNKVGDLLWLKQNTGQVLSVETIIVEATLSARYSITGDQSNGEYNLQITNAQSSDEGEYLCFADVQGIIESITSNPATLTVTVPQVTTPTTQAKITTKAVTTVQEQSTAKEQTPARVTTRPPAATTQPQGLVGPGEEYPLCAMTGDVIRGQTVVLSCYSNGGNPAAVLQWSRDDENLEPTYTETENGISSHLSFVVDDNLEGALFTCTSTHLSYSEPKMCSFSPLSVKSKQVVVEIQPATLEKEVGDEGMFTCEVTSTERVLQYVWSFDNEEIDTSTDERFHLLFNSTVLFIANITKDMDESMVECLASTANYTESATAKIEIVGEGGTWSKLSLVIVIAIVIVVIIVIIVSLVLFYCLWWKKRQEKEPLSNEEIIEDEDRAEMAPSPVAAGNPDVAYTNGQINTAYTIDNEIPVSKSLSIPPVRSHTPVGGRPQTADLDLRREQPVYIKKSKKHKKKKKRHNLIGPQELKPVKSHSYSDKPRVLDHFVVNAVNGGSPRHETDTSDRSPPSNDDNHHYETPQPLPSKSPKRSRRFDDPDKDGERPRSPTPESHRPRSPTPDKQHVRRSHKKHHRRRSVDDDQDDPHNSSSEHRDRPRSSSNRRSRSSSERRHHRRSRDDSRDGRRERRRHRPRSSHHRDSRHQYSEDSDIGRSAPAHVPPVSDNFEKHELEMKIRKTDDSDLVTTEVDDEKERRRSHKRGERSRDRHKRHRKSRDRHDSPHDD
ncbi:uncharacterized protein LOC144439700 [Glandiceps talaboti]